MVLSSIIHSNNWLKDIRPVSSYLKQFCSQISSYCGLYQRQRFAFANVKGIRNVWRQPMATFNNLSNDGKNILSFDQVVRMWQNTNAVCFDVDSTVVSEEGIDVLADHCGAGEAVAAWTSKAMNGSVLFQDALEARLALITPSVNDIDTVLNKHPLRLTEGMKELVHLLHMRNVHVYLVSGGFRQMINPIADALEIPRQRIFANNILFSEDGSYAGFDKEEPTSRSGGKAKVVADIRSKHGYTTIFMVGDGATDMEARAPGGADAFIGFGGITVRDVVKNGADWFVTDLADVMVPLRSDWRK